MLKSAHCPHQDYRKAVTDTVPFCVDMCCLQGCPMLTDAEVCPWLQMATCLILLLLTLCACLHVRVFVLVAGLSWVDGS
jgi:hypothetical protein